MALPGREDASSAPSIGVSPPIAPACGPQPEAGSAVPPRGNPVSRPSSTAVANGRPERSDDTATEEDMVAKVVENSPPWLFSMAFHMLAIIVMGLIVYVNIPSKPVQLEAETVFAEKEGDQLLFETPLGEPNVETTAEHALITPDDKPLVDAPLAAPGSMELSPEGVTSTSVVEAPQIGLALSGRQEGSARRDGLIGRYGGNATTEAAVRKGLAWLVRNQQSDGSWSLSGPYADGVHRTMDNEAAATAMALLALLGDGNTHQGGKLKQNVVAGWQWLSRQQDADGCFFQQGGYNQRFYTHGQCTIAVCELYGMTRDKSLLGPVKLAIDYCLRCQSPKGGWRYAPNVDSDVSVTGWIVMALQSARMAGLEVPQEALDKVERYLDDIAQYNGARYPYRKNEDVRRSMTAEALLMRQYLGWRRDDPRLASGVRWITSPENLVNFKRGRDVYFWYYATQVAHHFGGEPWKQWNAVMRQALPERQVPRGRESGSWNPHNPTADQWASSGGRLYVTCLSICMLEVYYRHLPIYASVD